MTTLSRIRGAHGRLDDAMQNMLELVTPSTSPQVMESLVRAIKVHFEQLPGRTLTPVKLSRMFSIDVDVAESLLEALVGSGYLERTPSNVFRRYAVH